jgi:hypothetical protein
MRTLSAFAVLVCLCVACLSPAPAGAAEAPAGKPWQWVTGSFEAKQDAGISFLLSNPNTTNASVTIRLFRATTQVGSDFTVTVQGRNTLTAIMFATTTGLHFATFFSNTPELTIQYRHTDASSVTHFVDAGDVIPVPRYATADALTSGLNTLTDAFNPILPAVQGIGAKVDQLAPKVDSINDGVGPNGGRIATLEQQVLTLRSELKSLRRLIERRLPARKRKRR